MNDNRYVFLLFVLLPCSLTIPIAPISPAATTTRISRPNAENITITFSGYFNITTTIHLPSNSTNSSLNLSSSQPWTVASSFNFSAQHGDLLANFHGGGTGAGDGGSIQTPLSSSATTRNATASSVGLSGTLALNDRAVAGAYAANAAAVNDAASATSDTPSNPCVITGGNLSSSDCTQTPIKLRNALTKSNAQYARANGNRIAVGVAATDGTAANAAVHGLGIHNTPTVGAALADGNGAAAGAGIGTEKGVGITNAWSNPNGKVYGTAAGVGKAKGHAGAGGGAAATGGSRAVGKAFVVDTNKSLKEMVTKNDSVDKQR